MVAYVIAIPIPLNILWHLSHFGPQCSSYNEEESGGRSSLVAHYKLQGLQKVLGKEGGDKER